MIPAMFLTASLLVAPTAEPVDPCNTSAWYVNPDEADREPTRTYDGLVFEPADLIHYKVEGLTTKDLKSGDYTLAAGSPAPDQDSFFSVEVLNADGTGYATLRYNRSTHLWDMVTGGQLYSNADPDLLVDMPPSKKSHNVVSVGIGYTKNPPGTKTVTVKSMAFQGKVYTFSCLKPTTSPTTSSSPTPSSTSTSSSPSASSTVSPSATASVSPSQSSSSPGATTSTTPLPIPSDAGSSGELPTTGVSLGGLIAGALAAVALGIGALFLGRRRRLNGTR